MLRAKCRAFRTLFRWLAYALQRKLANELNIYARRTNF